MPSIFQALPGIEVPVADLSRSLARMWSARAEKGGPAPAAEDAKATQVNFVLHLGLNAEVDDAVRQFQTAVKFSLRYPSRVVVLCPRHKDTGANEIRAKVYGECHVGQTKGDTRCIEFVLLSYPRKARQFLENQVSISLSTDLPLYYWAHRFTENVRLADYRYLLTRAKRVLIDSAIAPPEALSYPWPKPEAVRDLVYARLLPVRQSLGQFLSRYPMETIGAKLEKITVKHGAPYAAEGRVLSSWFKDRFTIAGMPSVPFELIKAPAKDRNSFAVNFQYGDRKAFAWSGDFANGQAMFDANFGSGKTKLPASVSLLTPESALSEAMFF